MMTLHEYLKKNKINIAAFSRATGQEYSRLHRIVNRSLIPRPDAMRAIFLASRGQITPNCFYDIERWKAELKKRGKKNGR